MPKIISCTGLFVMLFLAWLCSNKKKNMNFRLIASGILLQILLALLILKTAPGRLIFSKANEIVAKLVSFANAGSVFVFGENFKEHFFAFSVMPSLVFASSIMAVLFHLGILQKIVEFMAKIMAFIMDCSGSESLAAAANVFLGMSEAQLAVKPYIPTMTNSEIMAMMTGGMATISGATIVAYTGFGADAGHLIAASLISAPASLVVAKIMYPEVEKSLTKKTVSLKVEKSNVNLIDAACTGAIDGVKLAINIAAVVICFIAFVAMFNWLVSLLPDVGNKPLTLERMLGWLCWPLAFVMGVAKADCSTVGMLLGKKIVLNEFIAYMDLGRLKDVISPRSFIIATYALCGFANFGSIAIQVGGLDTIAPQRKKDFAKLGIRAMLGGALAGFMTATIAGIII